MFSRPWAWITPLVGAAAVFAGVLATTPPGFRVFSDVLFNSPRGPNADSAAYVLGSASSLALAVLLVLALASIGIDFWLRRRRGS